MAAYHIGEVAGRLGLSADTLRYYEKIELLPTIGRNASGVRLYNDKDIARVQVVQRAQKMNFSLAEIGELIKMRDRPQRARAGARKLTRRKLDEIEAYLADLKTLRNELQLLLELCASSQDGCPILENIDEGGPSRKASRSAHRRPQKNG